MRSAAHARTSLGFAQVPGVAKPGIAIYGEDGQMTGLQRGNRVNWRDASGALRWLTIVQGNTPMVRHMDFYTINRKDLLGTLLPCTH